MTDDERFEKFVREEAADYEAPRGDIPREAMWNAIRARRAPMLRRTARRMPARLSLWMGLAATLLLGVAIGRFVWQRDTTARVAVVPSAPAPTSLSPTLAPSPSVQITPAPDRSASPANGARRAASGIPEAADAGTHSYSVAAARHLEDAEALLVSYASSSTGSRADSLVVRWAKDLLSNTRLLLDSPAARDPVRARLLRDLEVILVQLVQSSPGGDAEARSTLDRTLNKTQIIPRLRSAVPASLHSGTD